MTVNLGSWIKSNHLSDSRRLVESNIKNTGALLSKLIVFIFGTLIDIIIAGT